MTTKKNISAKSAVRKITGHISFGEKLQAIRISMEWSQVKMAAKLKISKQDLCNIEKSRKIVSVERAVSFAKTLKLPVKTFATYALQDQLHKAGIEGEVIIKDAA